MDYTLAKIHLRSYAMKDIALVMSAISDRTMKAKLKPVLFIYSYFKVKTP